MGLFEKLRVLKHFVAERKGRYDFCPHISALERRFPYVFKKPCHVPSVDKTRLPCFEVIANSIIVIEQNAHECEALFSVIKRRIVMVLIRFPGWQLLMIADFRSPHFG